MSLTLRNGLNSAFKPLFCLYTLPFDDESEDDDFYDDEFEDDEFEDDDGVVVACSSYAYGFCDEGLDEEQLEEAFRVDDYDNEFFDEDDDEYLL